MRRRVARLLDFSNSMLTALWRKSGTGRAVKITIVLTMQFELIAKTFQGLEEVLAQELIELGADNVQIGRRMVSFTGDKEMMYRANFCLRTAVRILKPIKHFKATSAEDVYDEVRAINWADFLDNDTTFAVDTVVYSDEFRHSKFVAYKVKDAIVDYFRDTTGDRPNISISNPDIRLNMHIAGDVATLSLDSSGESLHLRGYRVATVEAPINEVLAAGLVKLSGWDMKSDFVDPFCGSGTLLIEAALMARNIYPGVFRKEFGFEKWKDFDADLFDKIYNDDSEEREFDYKFYGYDLNLRAVEAARANAKNAGVADLVEIEQRDVRDFQQPEQPAIMITNPPYGERLKPEDLYEIYRTLGNRLKHAFKGCEAHVISYKEDLFREIGMRPSLKTPLYNGALDCELRKYVIFDGKMKDFRAEGGEVKTEGELRKMGEKRRFKRDRGEFNDRPRQIERDDDYDPAYELLKRRHQEFVRNQDALERRRRREAEGEEGQEKRAPRKFEKRGGDKPFNKGGKSFDRAKKPYDRKDGGKKDFAKKPFARKFGQK